MSAARPDVSVVVATRNRSARLAALLDALRQQTLAAGHFEVVIVDDASSDETEELLARDTTRGALDLRVVRLRENSGPGVARERGWRLARAPIVAFTDDDCVPDPRWLEAGLAVCGDNPGAIVQGMTVPARGEWERLGTLRRPFTHAIEVTAPDPHLQTCNVFYPRDVLERIGGFDTAEFARNVGEDADLASRALESGASHVFVPGAQVTHACNYLGPLGKLRRAASWDLKVYARHPSLRRAWFTRRVFWLGSHYLLVRALVAAMLPRRMRLVRAWLGLPYAVHLAERGAKEGGGLLLAPYFALHDLLELAAAVRSTIRYRVPML